MFLCVKWCRQVGILSPILVNVYIHDLRTGLTKLKIGCTFHLVYADDTLLRAASPSALQKLTYHCVKFADGSDVFYNLKKTKCMCLRPKGRKIVFSQDFLNDHQILIIGKEKYFGAFVTDYCSDD